jgi:hypothetical protein
MGEKLKNASMYFLVVTLDNLKEHSVEVEGNGNR